MKLYIARFYYEHGGEVVLGVYDTAKAAIEAASKCCDGDYVYVKETTLNQPFDILADEIYIRIRDEKR